MQNVNFYLAGGNLFEKSEFNFPENLKYLGYMDNIGSFLKGLDLGLLLSHREGLSRVCVEMAMAKIPIIAYDTGICKDITKFVCDVGDIECVENYIAGLLLKKEKTEYNLSMFDIDVIAKSVMDMINWTN